MTSRYVKKRNLCKTLFNIAYFAVFFGARITGTRGNRCKWHWYDCYQCVWRVLDWHPLFECQMNHTLLYNMPTHSINHTRYHWYRQRLFMGNLVLNCEINYKRYQVWSPLFEFYPHRLLKIYNRQVVPRVDT